MRTSGTMLVVMFLTIGCAQRNDPAGVRHDPERAMVALVVALDSWKKGETQALARRDPPIRFVDDDNAAGLRLADYEIEEPDAAIGLHQNVAVILSLRDSRGKTIRREIKYQIATDPSLAVLRSDP